MKRLIAQHGLAAVALLVALAALLTPCNPPEAPSTAGVGEPNTAVGPEDAVPVAPVPAASAPEVQP